jgi:hypothetical protein
MTSGPSLLLDWEPRWEGFKSSVAPALHRSDARLRIECDGAGVSAKSISTSLALHVIFLTAMLLAPKALQPKVIVAENYIPTQITYYSGSYLPKMNDASGSEAGSSGRSGGSQGFHPLQVIRVSRGKAATDKNIDAPTLRPTDNTELANLVALTTAASPAPPAEAIRQQLRRTRQIGEIVAEVVQPAVENPKMKLSEIRMHSVSPQVVQPAPEQITRDTLSISKLVLPQADVIPPAPETAKLTLPRMRPAQEMMTAAAVPPVPSLDEIARRGIRTQQFGAAQVSVVQPTPTMDALSPMNGRVPQLPGFADLAGKPAEITRAGASGSGKADLSPIGSGEAVGGGDQKIQAIVISANPGNSVGVPSTNENGSIALSPKGTGDKGIGGSGGGTGSGKGNASGSGVDGRGPGSTLDGAGAGADLNAKNGTSKKSGPGGTGDGGAHSASPSGITISGGSVTLPGFGPANVPISTSPRKVLGPRHPPSITIVGSATSGGALNQYGALKGGKVYTIYIETRLGTAVLEFAEQPSSAQHFEADLTAPEPMQSEIPADVRNSRMIVSCVIGSDGVLRNLRVLESAAADMTAKVIAALQGWRFRPVLRGDQAIAVDAILGFDIDTR